uniref:Uncharacterized protein n=1 Tax=Oryza rufipogon TaxID=4529 RepID=A0A0E0P3T2_ORYRU
MSRRSPPLLPPQQNLEWRWREAPESYCWLVLTKLGDSMIKQILGRFPKKPSKSGDKDPIGSLLNLITMEQYPREDAQN